MHSLARRDFLKSSATAAAFTILPQHVLGGPGITAPSEKLNIAVIGAGGQGYRDAVNMAGENIVALCDVDEKRGAEGFKRFPKAMRYKDYRRMLDREEAHIDAVVVACPDHIHIPASVMAMRMGKHVYCEKPLGWRQWWDFGNGRLGDMGCHMLDLPFMALGLKYPLTAEADCPRPAHEESACKSMTCRWTFPDR